MESLVGMMPLLLMIVVIYFFFIRPQSKKQKEQTNFVNDLKKGTEVVTGSGIIGKITKVDETPIVQLQIDQKTFVKVLKSTISKELTDALDTSEAK